MWPFQLVVQWSECRRGKTRAGQVGFFGRLNGLIEILIHVMQTVASDRIGLVCRNLFGQKTTFNLLAQQRVQIMVGRRIFVGENFFPQSVQLVRI